MYITASLLVTDMVLYYIYYCGDDPEATDEIDGCRAMSRWQMGGIFYVQREKRMKIFCGFS